MKAISQERIKALVPKLPYLTERQIEHRLLITDALELHLDEFVEAYHRGWLTAAGLNAEVIEARKHKAAFEARRVGRGDTRPGD